MSYELDHLKAVADRNFELFVADKEKFISRMKSLWWQQEKIDKMCKYLEKKMK